MIGPVLVLGGLALKLVSAETVRRMKPGSVIIDISIDRGGLHRNDSPDDLR